MRHSRVLSSLLLLAFMLVLSCGTGDEEAPAAPTVDQAELMPEKKARNQTMDMVRAIDSGAPRSLVQNQLPGIIDEIKKARQSDKPMVYEAISQLSEHPVAAEELQSHFASLPPNAFRDRQFALAIIGQMRSEKNLEFLNELVWAPLPPSDTKADQADGFSDRRQEEIVRAKAVHGIGYLRTSEAFSMLKKIMQEHESDYIRTVAIDTYLWNVGDDPKASSELAEELQDQYRDYVGIPRFSRETSQVEFQQKVISRANEIIESKKDGR